VKPRLLLAGFLVTSLFASGLRAQEDPSAAPGRPNWQITPTAAIEVTYTDNVSPGIGVKDSDFITRLAPGIKVEGKSARASGSLVYNWRQSLYADNSRLDNHQHDLRANGKLELVEDWMFLDASGNIAQRSVSAFGTQGIGNELANANRSETSTYAMSPYVKGLLGGKVNYELRYNHAQSSAKTGTLAQYGDTVTQAWTGRLSGATPLTFVGWSFSAEQRNVEIGSLREMRSSNWMGTLDYRIDPQVRLFLNFGRESDNYNLAELKQRTTTGYGVDWAPTERTLLSLKQDRRSYGDSYSATFTHRTALSAWRLSDSRSVSLPAQQLTQAPTSTAAELLNLQLTSTYPDPLERATMVAQLLAQAGIPADALVYGNILSAQAFVQRRQEASVSLTGVNNTVTFTLQRSSSQRLGTGVGITDDFALSSNIRQTGLNGNWAHKLSPHSSLTLSGLTSRSRGDAATQDTRLRSLSLLFTTKLGVHTTATAGLRRTSFDTTGGTGYDEQALTGSLFVTF
jgi:uncharacterized protein (PEP-CTERM system associated)